MLLSTVDAERIQQELCELTTEGDEASARARLEMVIARAGCASLDDLRRALHVSEQTDRTLRAYDEWCTRMEGEPWFVFMNHGYAPPDGTHAFPTLSTDDGAWQHQIFLYCHLVNAAIAASGAGTDGAIANCDLLEIGCGRGGGLSALKRYYGFRRAVGVDVNARQVAFCRERHRDLGLEFTNGHALDIPFDDSTFDLVVNIESSHSYADVARFLSEVRRVLRPDGLFLLADFRERRFALPLLDLELVGSGLTVVTRTDITNGVQRACMLDAERFHGAFGSPRAELVRRNAEEQARRYSNGSEAYMAYVLRNDGDRRTT